MPKEKHRGSLVQRREKSTYKCARTESSLLCYNDRHPKQGSQGDSCEGGKQGCPEFSSKDVGNPKSRNGEDIKTHLGISLEEGDLSYCRILPARGIKCDSGQGIQGSEELERMEVKSIFLQKDCLPNGDSGYRSVRIENFPSDPLLHDMETGSIQLWDRCIPRELELGAELCLSIGQSYREGSQESDKGQSLFNSSDPSLANSTMVPNSSSIKHKESSAPPRKPGPFAGARTPTSSAISKRFPLLSGVACLRRNLENGGLSSKTADLISESRRPSTRSHYDSAWGK